MAKTITFDQLLRKIADSEDFRATLVNDPDKALREIGVDPTPQMIKSIRGLDKKSLEAVAAAFPRTGVHADTFGIC